MTLKKQMMDDLKAAMKARDEVTKGTLRMLKSAIGQKELELEREATADEELAVLLTAVKSREESIVQYRKGGRPELADQEAAEIEVIRRYLPKPMSEDEAREAMRVIAKKIGAEGKSQMGQLMKAVMAEYRGRIDGRTASRLAGEMLA